MLALYTGLRSEDVKTMRFDQMDWDDETLHLPNPITLRSVRTTSTQGRPDGNRMSQKQSGWSYAASS